MSQRERGLATVVILIVFLGGNYLLIDSFLKSKGDVTREIATKARQLKAMRTLVENRDFWAKRDQWVSGTQPKITDDAGVKLLDRIKAIAQQNTIVLENPNIRAPEPQPTHTSVTVEIETKSGWSPLVNFLHELQAPTEFIALENANLKIDPTDPTQIRGRFKISRWYAPQ
jgi:hypothetical protein